MTARSPDVPPDERVATVRFRLVFTSLVFALVAIGIAIALQFRGGAREATPDDAIELVSVVETIETPETGPLGDPQYVWKRFDDGAWIGGFGRQAKASARARGVIAVKDSTGAVRLFFGPVDGAKSLKTLVEFAPSLRAFYVELLERRGFEERVTSPDGGRRSEPQARAGGPERRVSA